MLDSDFLGLRAGDEVAVMPWDAVSTSDVCEIAIVQDVGALFVVLTDGRMYSIGDGIGFGTSFGTRIRRATVRDKMALAVTAN